jgi:hypothetical protein
MMSQTPNRNRAWESRGSPPVGSAPRVANKHAAHLVTGFTVEGLRRRCAPKHRKSRRETAGWLKDTRRCLFFVEWHGPGGESFGPSISTGAWLKSDAPCGRAPALASRLEAGALSAVLHQFHCGENEIQARLITCAIVGATPTPATTYSGGNPAAGL